MKAALSTPLSAPAEREVRDQVERIVASATFRPADRLKHFISFVAGQVLQGKGDTLKEYAVGVQVFGRDSGFDPRTDPVVRVQARRLRDRLERYYNDEGQNDAILVDLPKGGYAPVFKRRDVPANPNLTSQDSPQRNTIAVPPIEDLTAERRLEPFCSSLSRELIRRLTQLKPLKVVSAFSPQVAAGLTLEGAVQEAAEGLRLSVNLVNATTGHL
jgi:serine/threonine-protein kinase